MVWGNTGNREQVQGKNFEGGREIETERDEIRWRNKDRKTQRVYSSEFALQN